jgi:hypothetical protein
MDDIDSVCKRVSKLELESEKLKIENKNQSKEIHDIHKALIGNGQPGLLAEWNQWKGSMKSFKIIIGFSLTFMSVAIGLLAYLR